MNETDLPRLETGDWSRLGRDAASVRVAVFVREQGIPEALEWDAADAQCLHCVAYVGDRPVATGRLLPDAHIGRMAVLPEVRGTGLGRRVLLRLIDAALARGVSQVRLSAQVPVLDFYARHGFVGEGPVYEEVGIPHQAMRRDLRPDPIRYQASEQRADDQATLCQHDWAPDLPQRGAVYLLHGLGEHAGRHDALARWLCLRGWRVRAHDHVGHGRSHGRRGTLAAPDQLVRHARAQIERFAATVGERPVLLGHSLGGALAAELVVHGGLSVRGLVLSSPALSTGLSSGHRLLASLLSALAPNLTLGNGLDPAQISGEPAVVAAYRADPLVHDRISPRLVRWLLRAGAHSLEAAPALAVPTLMLVSGADRLVDPSGSRRFAQTAPVGRVRLHWYPDLQHEVFNETEVRRAAVLDDLGAWLEQLPESGLRLDHSGVSGAKTS